MKSQGLQVSSVGSGWIVGDTCSWNWGAQESSKFIRGKEACSFGHGEFKVSVGYPGGGVSQAVGLHRPGDPGTGGKEGEREGERKALLR